MDADKNNDLAPHPLPSSPDAAVMAFVGAADRRDLAEMEALLHPDFRVAVTVLGSDSVRTIDRATYLSLLGAGKLGGTPRRATIDGRVERGAMAHVTATLVGDGGRFSSAYSLAGQPGGWRLLQDATVFEPARP